MARGRPEMKRSRAVRIPRYKIFYSTPKNKKVTTLSKKLAFFVTKKAKIGEWNDFAL